MNKVLKRSVATLLTAGMLLAGLTACDTKTPEEKKEESLLTAFNKDTNVEFEQILYTVIDIADGEYSIYVIGYNKELSNDNDKRSVYQEAKYVITKEEFDYYNDLNDDWDVYYPFSEESTNFIRQIIEKYDPEYVDKAILTNEAFNNLDEVVEEYCK